MVGSAVGELVIVGRRNSVSRLTPVGWTLLAELVPLAALLISSRLADPNLIAGMSALLVALAAIAMGIQSAAVLRLHPGPTTTYVTGTLTTFTTETIRWLQLIEAAVPRAPTQQDSSAADLLSNGNPWIYGITWLVYAGGAVVSPRRAARVPSWLKSSRTVPSGVRSQRRGNASLGADMPRDRREGRRGSL
jgi:uncharacterized membrane protein YoaK (UPF0700 family)